MDKTIEVIVVAMVAIATAAALIFMVQGQSDGFLDFTQGETSSAKCDLWSGTHQCGKFRDAGCSGTCESEESSQGTEENSETGDDGIDCDTVENPGRYAECSGTGIVGPGS